MSSSSDKEVDIEDPWVVRHYGDGAVSYHSLVGPVVDPVMAHLKSQEVAEQVVRLGEREAAQIGMRMEAVALGVAVHEYRTETGIHAPGAAGGISWRAVLLIFGVAAAFYLLARYA